MSERIENPPTSYHFEDPTHDGKARCAECFRQAQISPSLQDFKPLPAFDGPCCTCGETKIEKAVRNYQIWQAMGEGGAALESLAPNLRAAGAATQSLATELARRCQMTTNIDALQMLYTESLQRHQQTWEIVCRLVSQTAETVAAVSLRSFAQSALFPTLELHLAGFSEITDIDGHPSKRIFGRRTHTPASPKIVLLAPIVFDGKPLVLNPALDFSPLGPGDEVIHVGALFHFATAVEEIAQIAEVSGTHRREDEGKHAWQYFLQFIEEYGIRPKAAAEALRKAGIDRSSAASIEAKLNVRLSQLRREKQPRPAVKQKATRRSKRRGSTGRSVSQIPKSVST